MANEKTLETFQALSALVTSEAWKNVIKPTIKTRISDLVVMLVDEEERLPNGTRVHLTEHELRHYRSLVKVLNWLLDWENQTDRLAREIEESMRARQELETKNLWGTYGNDRE